MIGFTSQLPHVLAVALINSDRHPQETSSFVGDSYRELTRIANINGPLWSQLFLGEPGRICYWPWRTLRCNSKN